MRFRVKYIIQTSSRCGKYNYGCTDTVTAENEDEAKRIIKAEAGNKVSLKRFRVLIQSVAEVA